MNKSIQLVTLPSGVCVLHIESEYDIEMITLPSEEVAYQCILASDELCAMALDNPSIVLGSDELRTMALDNPMLDEMLTNLISEI